MRIDIDKLEALARVASKGPWHVREQGPEDFFVEAPGSPDMPYRLDVCGDDYVGHGDDEQRRRNWDFIAAADPDVILALVARLREAEAWEQALAAHVERLNTKLEDIDKCLYGEGLMVAGHHLNGDLEPMDTFFEESDWSPEYDASHSLARRDGEQFRQGFWWGFERARCHPDQTNIRAEYEDVQDLRRCQTEQADTAKEDA